MKTAKQWIDTIQDKTVKSYLKRGMRLPSGCAYEYQFNSMEHFILCAFVWSDTPQGFDFWQKIWNHFEKGSGLITYEDFKHLDKSVNNGN